MARRAFCAAAILALVAGTPVTLIALLVERSGRTETRGLFVVRTGAPAARVADLKGQCARASTWSRA